MHEAWVDCRNVSSEIPESRCASASIIHVLNSPSDNGSPSAKVWNKSHSARASVRLTPPATSLPQPNEANPAITIATARTVFVDFMFRSSGCGDLVRRASYHGGSIWVPGDNFWQMCQCQRVANPRNLCPEKHLRDVSRPTPDTENQALSRSPTRSGTRAIGGVSVL